MDAPNIGEVLQLAIEHHRAGRLVDAESLYREILKRQPEHADALHYLGLIALKAGRSGVAVELLRRAVLLKPLSADAHGDLGNALKANGQLDLAISAYRRAIGINPKSAPTHNNLGIALKDLGKVNEAIDALKRALLLNPDIPEAHYNLALVMGSAGQIDEAAESCRRAVALRPNYPQAHCNLGVLLKVQGETDQAIASFQKAIYLKPNFPEAYSNLGNALQSIGRLDDALAAYRKAIALSPQYRDAHGNLINALHLDPNSPPQAIAQEQDRWNRQHAQPLATQIRAHANDRNPNRRLRVGYVSADFRDHVVGRNLLPLFEHHDRQKFEVTCYANLTRGDEITARIKQYCDRWRISRLSDDQAARVISDDQIDLLVDLSLHTAGNRSLIFAHKPAAVQVTFAGYPASTGLTTIDYRLSDPWLDPPGMDESIYSEQTIRLPDSFWCYQATDLSGICVNALPATSVGSITFGCLGNFCKANEPQLKLWAQVMMQVPGSRLIMLVADAGSRGRTLDLLARQGIAADRVEFVGHQPRAEYMKTYHRIDIGLDTHPYNGHTTSLDSFWMGVPVVTLAGKTAVSRAGLCQLSNLGLAELAADTPEEFVRIAVELAMDIPRVSQLRSSLRQRMERSPLMDAERFARNIEAAFREIWQRWCGQTNRE